MHIYQFEKSISKTILTRGKKYFKDGHVVELAQISPNAWRAEVEGTDDYFVFVELANGRIATSVCNCPFDGCCKHEVAVYYAIREALAANRQFTLPESVRTQSKEALLTLIEQMVQDYPTLGSYFRTTEADKVLQVKSVEEARTTITWPIHEYSGYDGTVCEDYADEAFRGFYGVLDEAQEIVAEDAVHAVRLLLVCQEELVNIQGDFDEAYIWDELYANIHQATFEVLGEIQEEAAAKAVTDLLMGELRRTKEELEDPSLLLNMLIELSPFAGSRTQIEQQIKACVFPREERVIYMLDLLLRLEADAEIASYYIKEPLATGVRERLIDHAVAKNDVESALLLCANGIDQPDASDYYKRAWLKKAFYLQGKQGNTGAQRFIAFELALKGNMEDFTRLKSLYTGDVELWRDMLENYLLTLEENRVPAHYATLLVQEEQWGRLLRYCQAEPLRVLKYADALKSHYEAEVRELAAHYFQQKVGTLNSRGPYKNFAKELAGYANSGYRAHALELKGLFAAMYAKKRAFVEELEIVK